MLVSTLLAAAGAAGVIVVAAATDVGAAPGNGEQVFDAPGCERPQYDGPSTHTPRVLERNCPRPAGVILAGVQRVRGGWRVQLDATRSFDSLGGRIVKYLWLTDQGAIEHGARVTLRYTQPGAHAVQLRVTNDSGSLGTAVYTVRLR
ncbi:MAG TPA: PKD domain-containing protein [Solirubrobacteraceae bacterium]|nr:PKD domain-containing protein [Solirubrobacteraceae bacterium]